MTIVVVVAGLLSPPRFNWRRLTGNWCRAHRKTAIDVDDHWCPREWLPDCTHTRDRCSAHSFRNLCATNLDRVTVSLETLSYVPQSTMAHECSKTNWLYVRWDRVQHSHKSAAAYEICGRKSERTITSGFECTRSSPFSSRRNSYRVKFV